MNADTKGLVIFLVVLWGAILGGAVMFSLESRAPAPAELPRSYRTNWLGPPLVGAFQTNGQQLAMFPPNLEIGARSDGVVVWRARP